MLFLNDNARPDIVRVTQERIMGGNTEVLPHPPNFVDLAPSDYHFFPGRCKHF